PELFPEQNMYSYIDLTDYENGIVDLCHVLGASIGSLLSVPRAKDFGEELDKQDLVFSSKRVLLQLYSTFAETYAANKSNPKAAEETLHVLRLMCQSYRVRLITPQLALAILLARSLRDKEALETFLAITEEFEADPRGWAGVGAAQYYLR